MNTAENNRCAGNFIGLDMKTCPHPYQLGRYTTTCPD